MKRRLALIFVLAATAFGAGTVTPTAVTPAYAKSCSASYVHAALSWGHKCLRAGQYCKRSADREYHRYGFHCHRRDSNGDYHLSR